MIKKENFTYVYDTNQFSLNRIVQFEIDGFDMESYLESMPKTITSIDPITNQSEESVKNGTDTKTSKKDPDITDNINKIVKSTRGTKQGKLIGKDKQYFNTINNANKCRIWVPGVSSNLIGKKITVVFPKPTYYDGEDEVFEGEWEVYAVRDKVIGFYYMMELFLRKP